MTEALRERFARIERHKGGVELRAIADRAAGQVTRPYEKRPSQGGLNVGNCLSYALAKGSGEPLVLKGDDFTLTDIEAATYARGACQD